METLPATGLIDTVLNLQQAAAAALAAGDPATAYATTVQALELLGNTYELASVCDDTGLTRTIAAGVYSRGELQRGAEAMSRVLADRIAVFRMKFGTTAAVVLAPQPVEAPAPAAAATALHAAARFCIACGAPRGEGAAFCTNCGARMAD